MLIFEIKNIMEFKPGNKFWEIRSKHGRDKLFATPDLMWEAAVEYFQWCEANPLVEEDYRGKDATKVLINKMRPYTMQGLCRYLDCNTDYFNQFKANLIGKTDDLSVGFSRIVKRIYETVYDQKFSGAASGFLNANIIARDLGLSDKSEIKADVRTEAVDYSKLSAETLEEIANASNKSGESEG